MPLLNFKPQFVEPIQSGRKNHTIRATRKIPIKPSDKLYLYCGARTKNCFRILAEPQICTRVKDILIEIDHNQCFLEIQIDGIVLECDEMDRLAIADGFPSFAAFIDFWTKTHGKKDRVDFTGQIIHWR